MPQAIAYLLAVIFGGLGLLLLIWRPGPRWWIGVRTPWTFADREIWDKSWVMGGVGLLVMATVVLVSTPAFFISLVLFIAISLLYPMYLYWRRYGTIEFWKDVGWVEYRPVVRCLHCGHVQKLRDATQLAATICEACGLSCRS